MPRARYALGQMCDSIHRWMTLLNSGVLDQISEFHPRGNPIVIGPEEKAPRPI